MQASDMASMIRQFVLLCALFVLAAAQGEVAEDSRPEGSVRGQANLMIFVEFQCKLAGLLYSLSFQQ